MYIKTLLGQPFHGERWKELMREDQTYCYNNSAYNRTTSPVTATWQS